ncbi:Mitochondrial processing peptidase-like protein [Candidatus Rhodobacter oscarellae]|uniref:Mitochondrial processing peptidase-like protein n=1 Tax=Candidatus Rhodobacter oscarellae TaxID=1675527 RepID=A0A0J9EA83_9RHOB|nr:pitrilysin family protein [Candidatus Rhodobacter lobularis]KMW59546.1 Mitochondrial processing peptidase-like protein [Candidatus Rhodobacter lobularis]
MTVKLHEFDNGFRVVTEYMPGLKSAAIGVWVMAGGRHERIEQNGIAHFLEHMAFKGTERRSALQIAEEIEDVGGYINAYTSREMTAYYARVLEDDVPLALDVLSDIVLNPVFDESEIEVERGVILQEIGQVMDTPDDVVFDWLQEVAYPEQPLGRTILGPTERVSSFSRGDLRRFVGEHYRPEKLILSVAGGFDHDQIMAEAERLFAGLERGSDKVIVPAQFAGGERREIKTLEQVHFALAFETPGYLDDAVYTAQIYSSVLGGGMSSRLFQEIRERRGLCYSIFAQTGAYADTGMTTIYAGTSGEQIDALTNLTVDELKRAAGEITQTEVDRARAQMKAGMLMGLESPSARAERLARLVAIWGEVPSLDKVVAKIDAVTVADVRAHASGLITTAQPALTMYGPVDHAPHLAHLKERLAA